MNLELRNLSLDFDGVNVLNDISFQLDFTSMAVIGPSGGGKSTLLRIVGGLLSPSSGEVLLDGEKIPTGEKSLRQYRKSIGFVFQSKGLFEHLTALENVTLPLVHTFGIDKLSSVETAKKLFDRFGLSKELHKYPAQLSGGQQQRVAIARAVAVKPKLLLLDEPTSALDPEYTKEVLDMLSELSHELMTLLVTHEMGFAKNACEKLLFLAGNQAKELGDSMEIFAHPKSPELQNFLNTILEWKA